VSSHVSPRVVYVHAARKLLLCAYALEVMNPIVNSVCCLIVLMWILGEYVVKIFFVFAHHRKAEVDKPPSSFYVIRIMGRPPCIVLRIAFLGGTSSRLRKEVR
jgi:hypothetical protein